MKIILKYFVAGIISLLIVVFFDWILTMRDVGMTGGEFLILLWVIYSYFSSDIEKE